MLLGPPLVTLSDHLDRVHLRRVRYLLSVCVFGASGQYEKSLLAPTAEGNADHVARRGNPSKPSPVGPNHLHARIRRYIDTAVGIDRAAIAQGLLLEFCEISLFWQRA